MSLKSVKHAACYLSGSADSAVAALLLRKKGYYVTGVFLENRFQSREAVEQRRQRALATADALQMPLHQVALSTQQWDNFVNLVVDEYKKKRVPSLEVLFTKSILFGRLLEKVLGSTGADFITSGHFVRTSVGENIDKWTKLQGSKLIKALDTHADDSHLISQLPQTSLQKLYFPLGELASVVIPKIVETSELKPLSDQLSQTKEMKLVDEEQMQKLLGEKIPDTKGSIVHLESGRTLAAHEGLHLYPVGRQLTFGDDTLHVAARDELTNQVQVVDNPDHPALYSSTFFTALAHWCHETPYNFFEKHTMDCSFCFDAHQPLTAGALTVGAHNEWCGNDHIIVSSSKPVRAITPGQITTFYQGEQCIGSATILKPGPSEYAMNYKKYTQQNVDNGSNRTIKKFFTSIFPKTN